MPPSRSGSPLLTLLCALLSVTAASVGRSAEFVLFKNIWGDVIVATDMTTAGKELTPPTPQQPVYYKGLSLGRKLGSIPGDREPDIQQLNQFVAEVLARQGYRPAPPEMEAPDLLVVLQWGYLKPGSEDLLWFLGYNPAQDIAAQANPNMLGPEVWRRGFRSREIETILQDSQNSIYGIIVTAFEFKTARSTEPVAYWQTRIGLPASGKSMASALPVMIAAAGPAIGRASDKPLLVNADIAREGQVKLGELKFLDFESSTRPAEKASDGKN